MTEKNPAIDYADLNNEKIEDLVIRDGDLIQLYRIDVFLERQMSATFAELSLEKLEGKRTTLKSKLSWTENMREICKKRQYDLKTSNDLFNWNFRVEAEKILPPELYKRIAEAAKR